MQPHQERVVAEKVDLDIKLAKLESFLRSDPYVTLDPVEQSRLVVQANHMHRYSEVLGDRIAAFPGPPPRETCNQETNFGPCLLDKGHEVECDGICF